MTKYVNQDIGSHDDKSHEYVSVWWDPERVERFAFHSVGVHDAFKAYSRIHGIQVEARYVWAAMDAFHCSTNMLAIRPDGKNYCVTHVSSTEIADNGLSKWEEMRMGDKYGPAIARMERGPYVEGLTRSLVEE